jgi:hypothetical protein
MTENPDNPITVPMDEHQRAIDAVVQAIQANRGTPELATVVKRTPSATYNTRTGELTYHSEEDARLAEEQAAAQASGADPLDGASLQWEMDRIANELRSEVEKLNAHTFDPQTGAKVFSIPDGSEARRVQEQRVNQLIATAEYQKGVFESALAARDNRAAAVARGTDAVQIGLAWTGGDPRRQALLDKALEEAQARHVADAMLRAKLGILGE